MRAILTELRNGLQEALQSRGLLPPPAAANSESVQTALQRTGLDSQDGRDGL
jgi:hypothetical protein